MSEAPCADALDDLMDEYEMELTPAQQLNLIGPGGIADEPCGESSNFDEKVFDVLISNLGVDDNNKDCVAENSELFNMISEIKNDFFSVCEGEDASESINLALSEICPLTMNSDLVREFLAAIADNYFGDKLDFWNSSDQDKITSILKMIKLVNIYNKCIPESTQPPHLANFSFNSIFTNPPTNFNSNRPSLEGQGCGHEFNSDLSIDYLGGPSCIECMSSSPLVRDLDNGNCVMDFTSCSNGFTSCMQIRIPCSETRVFIDDFVTLPTFNCP